jgi:hypothetical protein
VSRGAKVTALTPAPTNSSRFAAEGRTIAADTAVAPIAQLDSTIIPSTVGLRTAAASAIEGSATGDPVGVRSQAVVATAKAIMSTNSGRPIPKLSVRTELGLIETDTVDHLEDVSPASTPSSAATSPGRGKSAIRRASPPACARAHPN